MASSRVLPSSYNEKTYGSAVGRDYSSLAIWEGDTDIDLVTAAKGEVLTCYADSATYNDSVIVDGATTNASYFRVIRAASGHRGTPTSGVYFELTGLTSAGPEGIFIIMENYSGVYDVAIKATGSSIYTILGILLFNSYTKVIGCTIRQVQNLNAPGQGIYTYGANCVVVNCLSTNCSHSGFYSKATSAMNHYIYNCTSLNNTYNYTVENNATVYVKNCISMIPITSGFYDSGTGSHSQTTNVTSNVLFETDGYHLKSGFTGSARNQGTDLSADAVFPFNDDIDGDTITRGWSIGCDWYAPVTANNISGCSRILPTYYYESHYGSGKNYTSLAIWEADSDYNLTTNGIGEVLTCYEAVYNDNVTMEGSTTSSTSYRVVRAASGQRGTPISGVRFEKLAVTVSTYVVRFNEQYSQIHDIATTCTSTTASCSAVGFGLMANGGRCVGCSAYNLSATGTSSTACGFYVFAAYQTSVCHVINCFAYNVDGTSSLGMRGQVHTTYGYNLTTYFYNCISTNGNHYGFNLSASAGLSCIGHAKNCISQNNVTNTFSVLVSGGTETWNETTNITSNGAVFQPDGYKLQNVSNTGVANPAINTGTDLTSDATFPFKDDIDYNPRPSGANTWDIGCHEYIASTPKLMMSSV